MSHACKPADWDLFSSPPIVPVQYYSILRKKREFYQQIKQNDILKNGYSHYCSIVPQSFGSNLSNEYEIFILFFDEIPHGSFIGFRVKACKKTFTYETNLLLSFLKQSSKGLYYLMNNNFIHVKCGISDAWELFYHLYDGYLRRYVVTVIGTQFFNSIFYSHFIQKEKQLLEMLYKGSKVVRISKKSVFYKIHRKRKLSVTDLVYTTYNMPKSKKCAMSCFRFKKLPVILKGSKFYPNTAGKNLSDFTNGKMKKAQILHDDVLTSFVLTKEIRSPLDSSIHADSESLVSTSKSNEYKHIQVHSLKRKFGEIESNIHGIVPSHTVSKCFNSLNSKKEGYIDHWRKYSDFKPYAVQNYSDIPSVKHVVPCLLNDGSLLHDSANSYLFNVPIQDEMIPPASLVSKLNAIETALKVKSIYEETNPWSQNYCENILLASSENIFSKGNELAAQTSKANDSHRSKFASPKSQISQLPASDPLNEVFSNISRNIPTDGNFENILDSPDDVSFSTAAGKIINVSNTALLSAQNIIKDIFHEKEKITSPSTYVAMSENKVNTNSFKDIGSGLKNKKTTEKVQERAKTSAVSFSNKKNNDPEQQFCTLADATENFHKEYSNDEDDINFITAGGKNLNVSKTAMFAAQKIMHDVLTDAEKQVFEGETCPGSFKNGKYHNSSAFRNKSCSSKNLESEETNDIDMDGTLVAKFFEDIPFDEKELEQAECVDVKPSTVALEINKNCLSVRRPRKSLGGRRNMKYSEKL